MLGLETGENPDDLLSLMFLCCHPALSLEAQVALTLRSVAGLTTAEVARAFLVSEDTMTRRLTRAKQKISEALARGNPGRYALQSAIAGCHAQAFRHEDTDYTEIAGLYARLEVLWPTPVVRLNRAVAVGLARGPLEGLALVEALGHEPALTDYPPLAAARADFLRRLGRWAEAAEAYHKAIELAPGRAKGPSSKREAAR